jgi:hypothetical protein
MPGVVATSGAPSDEAKLVAAFAVAASSAIFAFLMTGSFATSGECSEDSKSK